MSSKSATDIGRTSPELLALIENANAAKTTSVKNYDDNQAISNDANIGMLAEQEESSIKNVKIEYKSNSIIFDSVDKRRLNNLETALLYSDTGKNNLAVVEYEMKIRNMDRDRIEAGYDSLDSALKAKADNVKKIHDLYTEAENSKMFDKKNISEIVRMRDKRRKEVVDAMGVRQSVKYTTKNLHASKHVRRTYDLMKPRKSFLGKIKDAVKGTFQKYLGNHNNGLCYNT